MIAGLSFAKGVMFHDTRHLACAEVKGGVIHTWAERITVRTVGKIWLRIFFSLPWGYQLFHLVLALNLFFHWVPDVTVWWVSVYAVGFHFVFPRSLKQFHGAEHKVFSHRGVTGVHQWEAVKKASIVNKGCSTKYVMFFFLVFLPAVFLVPLPWAIGAGAVGMGAGVLLERTVPKAMRPFYSLSGWLQRRITTREPERIHLETAIRSYVLLQHVRKRV